jgi:hypothetical protein
LKSSTLHETRQQSSKSALAHVRSRYVPYLSSSRDLGGPPAFLNQRMSDTVGAIGTRKPRSSGWRAKCCIAQSICTSGYPPAYTTRIRLLIDRRHYVPASSIYASALANLRNLSSPRSYTHPHTKFDVCDTYSFCPKCSHIHALIHQKKPFEVHLRAW